MKIRRLSEIDLANLAVVPEGPQLERALRGYNRGGGSWSYNPVRNSSSDAVGARTPLHGELAPVSWEKIEKQITSACTRGADQIRSNVEVGKVLFDESRALKWVASNFLLGRLPIGVHESVRYWSDVILADDGGVFVPFFDHRRSHGIFHPGAKQFVFSLQHLWVRERHPDLADARLAIIRFPTVGAARKLVIDFHQDDDDLLPYDELNARVRVIYETWAKISAEPTEKPKRTGTGGQRDFGF